MTADSGAQRELEIAHILFIDIVGYSKLLTDDQREFQQQLNDVVRSTAQFRAAQAANKLVRLPAGDGMALVFFTNPEAPIQCASEIAKALRDYPKLQLRMGISSFWTLAGSLRPVSADHGTEPARAAELQFCRGRCC